MDIRHCLRSFAIPYYTKHVCQGQAIQRNCAYSDAVVTKDKYGRSAPQSSNMDSNMSAWAKANPALAKKVKGDIQLSRRNLVTPVVPHPLLPVAGQAAWVQSRWSSYACSLNASCTSGVGPVKDGATYEMLVEPQEQPYRRVLSL